MKKIMAVVAALMCAGLFFGCSEQSTEESNMDIPGFNYKKEVELFLKDDQGVEKDSFINTTKCEITNVDEAEERAKKECTIQYDTVDVFYDSTADMWKAFFYMKETTGKSPKTPGSWNSQTVFFDGDGLTQYIVYKE